MTLIFLQPLKSLRKNKIKIRNKMKMRKLRPLMMLKVKIKKSLVRRMGKTNKKK